MRFPLSIKSFSVVTQLEVSVGDGLVTTGYLNVIFTEQVDVSVETLKETINCRLEMFKILVHKTQVQVN